MKWPFETPLRDSSALRAVLGRGRYLNSPAISPHLVFFFQAEDGIRDYKVTGVQTCALPICTWNSPAPRAASARRAESCWCTRGSRRSASCCCCRWRFATRAACCSSSPPRRLDRKSTRLNSSHLVISYAVFCLKKKKSNERNHTSSEIFHFMNDLYSVDNIYCYFTSPLLLTDDTLATNPIDLLIQQ